MPIPFPTARDPLLSLFQSAAMAVTRRLHGTDGDAAAHPLSAAAGHVVDAKQNLGSPVASSAAAQPALTCAHLGLQLLEALATGDQTSAQALEDRLRFSACDPLWAQTLIEYARLYLPDGTLKPVPYRTHKNLSDFVIPAARPQMRVALLSDWGTGTNEAESVAKLLAAQKPDAVIHLGDIYFSGTSEECTLHFLRPLRALLPDCPLFTLCGNHDVYSGGTGYYALLDQIGQPASYFCLRSPDSAWQILAADTGLHDRNPLDETDALTMLEPGEVTWHLDKISGFPGRTILLSHHQPFSSFRQIGPEDLHSPVNQNLMKTYDTLAAAGDITAWFWGHEHQLRLYSPYRGIAVGRNIGYGAIPVAAGADAAMAGLVDPPTLLADVPLDVVEGAYTHGFALLDLSTRTIEASYWALTRPAGPIYRETLTDPLVATAGTLSSSGVA